MFATSIFECHNAPVTAYRNPQVRLQYFVARTTGTAAAQGAGRQVEMPNGEAMLCPVSIGYLANLKGRGYECALRGLLMMFAALYLYFALILIAVML